jgi:hypothetical protein
LYEHMTIWCRDCLPEPTALSLDPHLPRSNSFSIAAMQTYNHITPEIRTRINFDYHSAVDIEAYSARRDN